MSYVYCEPHLVILFVLWHIVLSRWKEKPWVLSAKGIHYSNKPCKCHLPPPPIFGPLLWPSLQLQPKAEVTSPSSDMNTTRDCPSPSASHNKPSDETSNPSSEGSFRGPLKLQLGSPDPGTHFCIVWASPGWDTDNPGFLLWRRSQPASQPL